MVWLALGLLALISPAAAPGDGDRWWSLRPLQPVPPPPVASPWVRTPVDAFIFRALEAKGLQPSPPADRRTLIRRLTYDLHGLPPTPEEIDSFLADPGADAYERLVDRLLASPRYGERWGRHWLDLVHYGDTHGYDKDKRRDQAWPYRDYVIRSFNQDKPYADFLREQLAGDVLRPGDPEAVIATGFIAAGPWDFVGHVELREGTVEKEKTRSLDRDDMVATMASTFLSLTVHCARCHDHKFDPITQADYYRLQAVFAGVERGNRKLPIWAGGVPEVYGVLTRPPRTIHILRRGDVEQPRSPASPGALECIPGLEARFTIPDGAAEGARRRALADWLAAPAHPLTSRSAVNRIWQHHFGKGLVDTPNDFGRNGSLPSHPELLDWLAAEFLRGGGSFKRLSRLIVTSNVYQQSSATTRARENADADNRLLGRMNRRRLDAESIRDAILSVSGQLDLRMGGPGFELFRFKDDHSPVYDHAAADRIHDPATFRRTVYRFTVRSVPNPLLDCLDCADPNLNTPVRNTTITALQALALLNDPFVIRQAEHFARRLEREANGPAAQLERGFLLALGRRPTPDEAVKLADHARRHGLANTCRVLLNTNEFVFVD